MLCRWLLAPVGADINLTFLGHVLASGWSGQHLTRTSSSPPHHVTARGGQWQLTGGTALWRKRSPFSLPADERVLETSGTMGRENCILYGWGYVTSSAWFCIFVSVCLRVKNQYLSIYLSVCLCVCRSVCPSDRLSIFLFVFFSFPFFLSFFWFLFSLPNTDVYPAYNYVYLATWPPSVMTVSTDI